MNIILRSVRLVRIWYICIHYRLDDILFDLPRLRPFRGLKMLLPWHWVHRDLPAYPVRVRLTLEALGPIFVKFGQILSTRRDLLPEDLARELAKLQDRVPPFPGDQARKIIEKAWECPIENVLERFDEQPLASASIAQVHSGQLHDGTDIIVKVLRPRIEQTIRQDIALMYSFAKLLNRYSREIRRLRPIEVVTEYKKTIHDELDLQREAANATKLRQNWEGSDILYIPLVYWDWTRTNVMVMERVYGMPINDVENLKAHGIDMKKLGEHGVEIFFTQVFRDNFFHADMHPGNMFVEPSGRYISIDFGIVGSLTPEDQRYLAGNLLAFFKQDYRRIAELHIESGWVPPNTRVDEFEAAIRTVSEPIIKKPFDQISFGHFLLRLFQTARRFNMENQPQLVLLQKTLLNIEGLGRDLYPQLDLWTTAKPYMERWMHEQIGIKGLTSRSVHNVVNLADQLPDLPLILHRILINHDRELQRREIAAHQPSKPSNLVSLVCGSVLMLCGTSILLFGPGPWLHRTGALVILMCCYLVSLFCFYRAAKNS